MEQRVESSTGGKLQTPVEQPERQNLAEVIETPLGTRIEKLLSFPQISYDEFESLPQYFKRELMLRNRITNTDTYNRTMATLLTDREWEVAPDEAEKLKLLGGEGTLTLQMRRSPFNYIVVCGVEEMLDQLLSIKISKEELAFAEEYYKRTANPNFNAEMWRYVVEECDGRLPFEIHGVRDGSVVLPGEPLLTVSGPVELIAHFEPIFHRIFYASMVATRAHELREIIQSPDRFVEVGKRGAIDDNQHYLALRAMNLGGGFHLTSDDAGPGLFGLTDAGTMGHRYVQAFKSEEAAFRHAIERLPAVSLLIDLVESYQGIDLALKLKNEYRDTDKKIWVRLDSGDIKDQVRYYLGKTNGLGLTDPLKDRLVVEGIDSLDEIREIEQMIEREFGNSAKRRVMYGAGGLLISEKTSRSDASTGFKLSEYTDELGELRSTMKFSSSPGKISYPGCTRLAIVDGKREILQDGESPEAKVSELFSPLYLNGKRYYYGGEGESAYQFTHAQYTQIFQGARPTKEIMEKTRAVPSAGTAAKIRSLTDLYGVA